MKRRKVILAGVASFFAPIAAAISSIAVKKLDYKFVQGTDAQEWAKAFKARAEADPSFATDEGNLLAWFANAIEAGGTREFRKYEKRIGDVRNALDIQRDNWKHGEHARGYYNGVELCDAILHDRDETDFKSEPLDQQEEHEKTSKRISQIDELLDLPDYWKTPDDHTRGTHNGLEIASALLHDREPVYMRKDPKLANKPGWTIEIMPPRYEVTSPDAIVKLL